MNVGYVVALAREWMLMYISGVWLLATLLLILMRKICREHWLEKLQLAVMKRCRNTCPALAVRNDAVRCDVLHARYVACRPDVPNRPGQQLHTQRVGIVLCRELQRASSMVGIRLRINDGC